MEKIKKEEIKYKKFTTKYKFYKDELQKKNKFLTTAFSLFNEQIKLFESITKNINSRKKIFMEYDSTKEKDYICAIVKLIYESFEIMMNSDCEIIKELVANLSFLLDCIKKESKKLDSELEFIYGVLKEEKIKLEKQKNIFYDSIDNTETKLLDKIDDIIKKNPEQNLKEFLFQDIEILQEAKSHFTDYRRSIAIVNKVTMEFNNKEKLYLDSFDNIENNSNLVISNILKSFLENQSIKNDVCSQNIKKIKDFIILNNNNILNNKEKDNYLTVSKYSFDLMEFENFESKKINFLNIKTTNEYKKYSWVVELLNKTIGNIYPNYSFDNEKKRNEVREIITKIIENQDTNNISEEEKIIIFKALKNNEDNQTLFINILNRLRSIGSYKKNKEIIELIGNSINIMLTSISINKNYEMAKLCILLSQTFYYENDKKEKIYIFEFIKDNEWFHSEDFWRNFIDLLIWKELMKYQNNLKDNNINIFMKNNISKNLSNKIEDILFCQLTPSVRNMVEFNIEKKIIVKIIEEFIHKYDYLKQEKIDSIYNLISDNKEEIQKLKEENQKKLLFNSYNIKNDINEDEK